MHERAGCPSTDRGSPLAPTSLCSLGSNRSAASEFGEEKPAGRAFPSTIVPYPRGKPGDEVLMQPCMSSRGFVCLLCLLIQFARPRADRSETRGETVDMLEISFPDLRCFWTQGWPRDEPFSPFGC